MTAYIRNNKVLVLIVAALLLSNLALLYLLLTRKDKRHDKPDQPRSPREYMIQTLRDSVGFTNEQIAKYEELADKHKEEMKPLFEHIQATKDSFFRLLQQPDAPDSVVTAYLEKIGQAQKNIDEKSYRYFRSLQQLCTEEQKPRFDTLIQRVTKWMISPRRGNERDKNKK